MPEVLARLPFVTESFHEFIYELEGFFAQIAYCGKHTDRKFMEKRYKEIENNFRNLLTTAYHPGWDINTDVICDAIDAFHGINADIYLGNFNPEYIKEDAILAHQILNEDPTLMDEKDLLEIYG